MRSLQPFDSRRNIEIGFKSKKAAFIIPDIIYKTCLKLVQNYSDFITLYQIAFL